MNFPSILVIDDEVNNFDIIEALLSNQEYDLHYAFDGQNAINSLSILQPDVILLDVMMPGMDGMEVCRLIKSMPEYQFIPIIMITALTAKEDLSRCLQAGANDFISKPVNGIELCARVNSMLRIKQQYDQIKTLSQLQINTIDILQKNLNELRGNLFSSLPHEFNTPLNGISGIIDMLLLDHTNMSHEEVQELLEIAQESSQRLENLTRKFLNYTLEVVGHNANIAASNIISDQQISDQSVIFKSAQKQAQKFHRIDDLVFNLLNCHIAVNPQHLQCIIEELLENALQFSSTGTSIEISSTLIDNMLQLSISDHGRGMTEEQIANVGAFMQFERKAYEQQGGVGLGLKIVQTITENYGGVFSISSSYHQATTVCLTLPLAA
ncbi:MAG: hybrid sensor histidine kinase/response regulator [Nostoc sp. TH1S01]|nr:hybrid sensor histidine kinase/response regulator [Nostoc sp. TH1S01]